LEATKTLHFSYRGVVLDSRTVPDHTIQLRSAIELLKLYGSIRSASALKLMHLMTRQDTFSILSSANGRQTRRLDTPRASLVRSTLGDSGTRAAGDRARLRRKADFETVTGN
jgi:hypothetical protein